MRKIILITINLLFTGLLFSDTDKQIDVKSELLRTFLNDELKISQYEAGMGYPSAMYFDHNSKLSIHNSMGSEILKLDENYKIVDSIRLPYEFLPLSRSVEEDENYIYSFFNYAIDLLDKNTNTLRTISFPNMSNQFRNLFGLYINDTYINWTKDNKIYSVENPEIDIDDNRTKLQGNDETVKLLRSEKFTSLGYRLDDKNRLFLHNNLITKDFSVFWYYWNDKNDSFFILGQERDPKKFAGSTYIGRDSDDNYIWHIGGIFMIFNNKGKFLAYFNLSFRNDKIFTQKNSDIFYLTNKEHPMTLYKIKKQW